MQSVPLEDAVEGMKVFASSYRKAFGVDIQSDEGYNHLRLSYLYRFAKNIGTRIIGMTANFIRLVTPMVQ